MAILQIKGIDDAFYARLKQMAAADSRSVSQEVLHLTKEYMARRRPRTWMPPLRERCWSWRGPGTTTGILARS